MNRQVKFDYLLLIVVLLLIVIGIAMIYSASSFKAEEHFGDSNYFLKKQLIRVLLGLILMVIFFNVDYHNLQKLSWLIFLGTLLLLVYVLIGGIKINGSRRSIYLVSFVFQPSEAAKYALILFLSSFLAQKGKRIREFTNGLLPALLVISITVILILLEPDLGTAIILFSIACIMLFASEVNLLHLSALGLSSLAVISIALANFSYQRRRLLSFIDTIRGIKEPSWQIMQSLISFSNGGFWGVGLGNSKQKLHFLPQPFTDFIYSIISEETGFVGAFIVMLLFLVFLWRGTWIALNAPDQSGKLLAIGITASISIYAFASVAIAINLVPITGISLPFISYGGSSLLMNSIGVGILLNISRQIKNKPVSIYSKTNTVTSQQRFRSNKVKRRKRVTRKI